MKKSVTKKLNEKKEHKRNLAIMLTNYTEAKKDFDKDIQDNLDYIIGHCTAVKKIKHKQTDITTPPYVDENLEAGNSFRNSFTAYGDNFKIEFNGFKDAWMCMTGGEVDAATGEPFYREGQFKTVNENNIYTRGNLFLTELLTRFREVKCNSSMMISTVIWDDPNDFLDDDAGIYLTITEEKLLKALDYVRYLPRISSDKSNGGIERAIVTVTAVADNDRYINITFYGETWEELRSKK